MGAPRLNTDLTSAAHAQIDTGAETTVTSLKYLLHHYRPFNPSNPPDLSYVDVYTYYSPEIDTTAIADNSFLSCQGKPSDYTGTSLQAFFDSGTCTFTCHHRLRSTQDLVIHGIYACGNSYTQAPSFPLISLLIIPRLICTIPPTRSFVVSPLVAKACDDDLQCKLDEIYEINIIQLQNKNFERYPTAISQHSF